MPKRIKQKLPADINEASFLQVRATTEERLEAQSKPKRKSRIPDSVSEYMAKIGSKGGKRSGKARLKLIDPETRREIAANAARTRWAREKEKGGS